MLYILQSRFTSNSKDKRGSYQKVPDAAQVAPTPEADIKV
jgi:hypothetical protein